MLVAVEIRTRRRGRRSRWWSRPRAGRPCRYRHCPRYTPALDRAARQHGARCRAMLVAVEIPDTSTGEVMSPSRWSRPEHALAVIPPALDRAARQQGARAVVGHADAGRRRDPRHVDGVELRRRCRRYPSTSPRRPSAGRTNGCRPRDAGRRRDPRHVDGGGAVDAVTDRVGAVYGTRRRAGRSRFPPALDRPPSAGRTSGDCPERCSSPSRSGHVDRGGAVCGGPVPELAIIVIPPALDRAARQQGARVPLPRIDFCDLGMRRRGSEQRKRAIGQMFMFTVVGLFRVARATRDRTDGRRISAVRASGTPGFAARMRWASASAREPPRGRTVRHASF